MIHLLSKKNSPVTHYTLVGLLLSAVSTQTIAHTSEDIERLTVIGEQANGYKVNSMVSVRQSTPSF